MATVAALGMVWVGCPSVTGPTQGDRKGDTAGFAVTTIQLEGIRANGETIPMDLPFILDIALGLIFIYLILSLIAAEVQELITTVLQWRADHLKKSIDQLLTGSPSSTQLSPLVHELYRTPLLRSLNQEAAGTLARLVRRLGRGMSILAVHLTRSPLVFDDSESGPSYVPPKTFATALLQRLQIPQLSHRYSELLLREAIHDKLTQIEALLQDLRHSLAQDSLFEVELDQVRQNLNRIVYEFHHQRRSLTQSLEDATAYLLEILQILDRLLINDHHCTDIIRRRLPYLRQSIALSVSPPTLEDVIQLLLDQRRYEQLNPELRELVDHALTLTAPDQHPLTHGFPPHLQRSLTQLARIAQAKTETLEAGLQQFETELAQWFDQAMERSRGVYKRNAKGIALLIGVAIAYGANADTLYMIERLSQDAELRSAINAAATQLQPRSSDPATAPPDTEHLQRVRQAVEDALDDVPLPLGRSPQVLSGQRRSSQGWGLPIPKRIVGWVLTGIALSMGADFWYNLFGRFMQVRKTGQDPSRDRDSTN
jgi:hypothetical protein